MILFNASHGQQSLHLPESLIVDNFAGGGGASTGIELALGRPVDIAINHDPQALGMHHINHPWTDHYCESVWDVDPREVCKGRPVLLAHFSPDCKHHSKAKGGKPLNKNIRGLAWVAIRWAATVKPSIITLENVEEFADWGPLDSNGRPDPKQKARTFNSFVNALRKHGYQVETKQLKACDFGAPTTRKRLFLIARRDGLPIVWPTPTHGPGTANPYVPVSSCIDWSIPVPSIFGRSRPLVENTMARIAKGIKRFVIDNPNPFIVPQGSMAAIPWITDTANGSSQRNMPASEPLRTITAETKGGTFALATAFISRQMNNATGCDLNEPHPTVMPGGAGGKSALVAAFLAKHYGGNYKGCGTPMDKPISTITTQDHHSVVYAYMLKYYGTNLGHGLSEPMQTLTTKHRFGLVTIHGQDYQIMDIGMRMLEPHELYQAQGFPAGYNHTEYLTTDGQRKPLTKTAQVRMVGNSVSPPVMAAIVSANVNQQHQEQRAAA